MKNINKIQHHQSLQIQRLKKLKSRVILHRLRPEEIEKKSKVILHKLRQEEIEKFKIGRLEKCPYCPKKVKNKSIKAHVKRLHSCLWCFKPKLTKKNLCEKCHSNFNVYVKMPKLPDDTKSTKSLEQKFVKKFDPNLVPKSGHCPFCNTYKEDLKNHLLTDQNRGRAKYFNCDKCNAMVSKRYCLVWHKSRAHDDKPKICVQCNITFPTNDNLDLHMYLVH